MGMYQVNNEKELSDISGQLKSIFSSEAGNKVLQFLQQQYIDPPCIADTPERTYYYLGQQELAKFIVQQCRGDKQ